MYCVSTLAGDGNKGYKEGKGSVAQFKYPFGICRQVGTLLSVNLKETEYP